MHAVHFIPFATNELLADCKASVTLLLCTLKEIVALSSLFI